MAFLKDSTYIHILIKHILLNSDCTAEIKKFSYIFHGDLSPMKYWTFLKLFQIIIIKKHWENFKQILYILGPRHDTYKNPFSASKLL